MRKQLMNIITLSLMFPGFLLAQNASPFTIELKANYRDSDAVAFPIPFPFPSEFLPPGETQGMLETVDEGGHGEISRITLFLEGEIANNLSGRIKIDGFDLYDRNPTNGDNKVDLDEAWLMYGTEVFPDEMPEQSGFYAKLGKFGKFERQNDRNLESYGLISTAYNRFEDAGLEIGVDLGRHFYLKASYTAGNPLFFRDPNALAGENGSENRNPFTETNPDPELKSGFVIFYDAELESIDFSEAETGVAMGARFSTESESVVVNVMAFAYNRDLKDEANITGSFYNGDLDLLDLSAELKELLGEDIGALFEGALPFSGRSKKENGANLWIYMGSGTLFAQYVDSDIANLKSTGLEVEASWDFEMPWSLGFRGKPILQFLRPAARYSKWDSDFTGNAMFYPAPTVWWDRKKLDFGLKIGLYPDLTLLLEHSDSEMLRLGEWVNAAESLATLTWKWNPKRRSR